jgi:sugar phosphate isomerase/epimerase
VVLVISGPIDRLTFAEADRAVVDGLRQLAPEAERLGIGLALEALHPMDMTQWTTVPTVDKALDLIDQVDSVWVGLMLDLYNAWWDPGLKRAIERAGSRILGVQLADWRNPTRSFTDRAVPGDGVAPLAQYIEWVERTGYRGWYDVEIFSDALWALNDYRPVIEKCREWWGRVFKEAGA